MLWAVLPPALLTGLDRLRGRTRRVGVKHKQWFWAYFFVAAALGWSTLFLFVPLGKAIAQSLTDFSLTGVTATKWVGLRNYIDTLRDPFWWRTVWVTVIFMVGTVPAGVLVSMFLAVQILKQPLKLQTFFKAALYLPGVIGVVVSAAVMKWIFHSGDGFANGVLHAFGVEGRNWFGDPSLAMPVIIAMVWLTANGVGVIVYAAAIGNIPRTYYEVSELDGASNWATFFSIT